MKHPDENLAHNLKRIREERNLSLDKLAELTGVSKSMLRQIEIGKSNPTISTIWKIANGLRIPFSVLFQEQSQDVQLRSFKGADPLLSEEEDRYRLFSLLTFNPERPFETYYIEIDPGTVFDGEPHEGNTEEHMFVLEGEVEITIAGKPFVVEAEQFISFKANCVHKYENKTEKIAKLFTLISYLP